MEPYNYAPVSAIDVSLYIGDQIVGGAQGAEIRVSRNKRPVVTMGSPHIKAIARGERLVYGTLTGVVLYSNNLKDAIWKAAQSDGADPKIYKLADLLGFEVPSLRSAPAGASAMDGVPVPAIYLDELPPLDITLVGVSESGETYVQRIYGAEIRSHGYTVDLNIDVGVYETVEFVAHHMEVASIDRL